MRFVWLGLAALLIGLGMTQLYWKGRYKDLQGIPYKIERTHNHMNVIAKYLRNYKKKTGNYPSNDEGLLVIPELVKACRIYHSYNHPLYKLRATDSGILTLWGEPFIYENRRGLEQSIFDESGVNNDKKRRYSLCVDKDVYVWSIAAKNDYGNHKYWSTILSVSGIALFLLLVAVYVVFIKDSRRAVKGCREDERSIIFAANVVGGFLLAAVLWIIGLGGTMATCYEGSLLRWRTPELTGEYVQVLTQYHEDGVISDRAYGKLLSALSRDNRNLYYRGHHDDPEFEE